MTNQNQSQNKQQLREKMKAQWPKLTDEDLAAIETDRNRLGEFIQQRHGVQQSAAETQVNDFRSRNRNLWPDE